MNIVITGSLGNIGKPLTGKLVAAGHKVTVISSRPDRETVIAALGAQAAIGSVSDTTFLTGAFTGADAVFAMTPPNMSPGDPIAHTVAAGKATATAIKAAGVPHVVLLSSIGADQPGGTGPITSLHHIEQLYRDMDHSSVTFLRAGLFYINFFNDVPMIKGMGILGANYPAGTILPLVHPEDIATAAAAALLQHTGGIRIQYIVSDVHTAGEAATALGTAIGKPELPWVEFTDEQSLQGMLQAGLPEAFANLYTEMGTGFREGRITADFIKSGAPVEGKIKLEDFAKMFAARF